MAFPIIQNPTTTDNVDDILSTGKDEALRYLGHDRASYGFVLFAPKYPNGYTFILPLPPQSIEMDEEAAVTITPTQGGGKFIENQGNIFKDIILSGTTGFLPLKNFQNTPGPSQFQLAVSAITNGNNAVAKQAFAQVSGYIVFQLLRSLFREYWQIHRTEKVEVRKQTSLFWVNLKDNEVWLVEPMSFRMSRASRSPMTYNYNIRLRTISKAAFTVPPDTSTAGVTALDSVRKTLQSVATRLDGAVALLNSSLTFFSQYRNLLSQVIEIIDTVNAVSEGLTNIASGVADVLSTPKSLLYAATASVTNVFEGIQNAADLIVSVPIDTIDGLTTSRQQLDFVLSRNDLFEKKWANSWNDAIANFNTTYGVNGDATDFIGSGTGRAGIVEATPNKNESIYQFANRIAGDATRAHEIIVLNNLRWPYISPSLDERAPGTVAPGDPVLVPVDFSSNTNDNTVTTGAQSTVRTYKDEVQSATSTTVLKSGLEHWRVNEWVGFTVEFLSGPSIGEERLIVSNTEQELTVDVPFVTIPGTNTTFRIFFKQVSHPPRVGIEELLGVDLRIQQNPITKKWDLVLASNGDFSLIKGQDNLNQALTIKFITTQGELILAPWFGLKPVFGQRGTPEALFRVRLYFEQTLLSDSRIESVEQLLITQVRDQYQTQAKLAVKGGLRSNFSSPLV